METMERWSRPSSGIRKYFGASTWSITGPLHGVNVPWMEVIDEADGFHCFGVELLRAQHGSSTLFQCEVGAKQCVHWVYPPADTVTTLPFGGYRSRDESHGKTQSHKNRFWRREKGMACYLIDRPRLSLPSKFASRLAQAGIPFPSILGTLSKRTPTSLLYLFFSLTTHTPSLRLQDYGPTLNFAVYGLSVSPQTPPLRLSLYLADSF